MMPDNDPETAAWIVQCCREELAKPDLEEDVRRFWKKNLDFNLACLGKTPGRES